MKTVLPVRIFRWVIALLFILLLAFSAKQKFARPLTPIFDPDTPGYLNPALSQLSGQGLLQTQGRSFLYPVMVLALLKVTGDLRSIIVMQHVASLLTAVAWIGIWVVWSSFLPRNCTRIFFVPLIGLAAVGFYLLSAETVMFGLQVRPEAVFPLAASLQLFCLMIYIRVRWPAEGEAKTWTVISSGAGAMLFAAAAYNLKPSWGFAILLSPLVLGIGSLFCRRGRPVVFTAIPFVLGCILSIAFLTGIPAVLNWKPDNASKSFLPMLLFAVHANIISDYLQSEADAGRSTPAEAEFNSRLRAGIEQSRNLLGSYRLLGHNPDYLMFGSKTLNDIPNAGTLETRKAFYFRSFFRAMAKFPDRFVKKWLSQLQTAAFQDPKYMCRHSGNLKKLYSISSKCPPTLHPDLREDVARSCSQTALETTALVSQLPDSLIMGPKWLKKAGVAGAAFFPFSLLGGLLLLVACPFLFRDHIRSILTASLISAAAFLSAMTVAFVHSFDIDRYLSLQSWLAWLAIACWTAVVLSMVESRLRHLLQGTKTGRETIPA